MICTCLLPDLPLPDLHCFPSPIIGIDILAEIHCYPILKPIDVWRPEDQLDQLLDHMDLYIDELAAYHDPDASLAQLIHERIRLFSDVHHIKIVQKRNRELIQEYEIRQAEIIPDRYGSVYEREAIQEPERIQIILQQKF